jgi:GH25 family lysozyme M1 (1,4-beta-N-acetylmuramidase)
MASKRNVEERNSTKLKTPWLDNVMKSIGASTSSAFSELYPNISDVTSAGINATKSIITSIRQTKATTNRIATSLKQNKYVQASYQALKNSWKDIKAGNIAGHDSDFGFGGMFADDDESSDITFGSDDVSEGEGSYNINVDNGTRDAVLDLNRNIQRQGEATVKIARANMDAQISMNAVSMQQLEKMNGMIDAHLKNVTNSLESIVKFNNESMKDFIQKSIGYYEAVGKREDNGASILKNEDDPLAALRDRTKGGIELSRYKNVIKKNAKRALSEVPFIGEIADLDDSMIEMFVENPLGMVSSMVSSTLMSKVFGSTMQSLETAFSNFVPVILDRLAEYGENVVVGEHDIGGHFKKFLAQTFGVRVNRKNTLSIDEFENSPIRFDKETKFAITEIITKELREQTQYLKIISGHFESEKTKTAKDDSEMFDFNTMGYIQVKDKRRSNADAALNKIMEPLYNGRMFKELENAFTQATKSQTEDKAKEERDALIITAKQLLKSMAEQKSHLSLDMGNEAFVEAIKQAKSFSGGKNDKNIDLVVKELLKISEQNKDIAGQLTAQLRSTQADQTKFLSEIENDPIRSGYFATGDTHIENYDEWLRANSSLYNTEIKKSLKNKSIANLRDYSYALQQSDPSKAGWLATHGGKVGSFFTNTVDTLKGSMNRLMSGPLDIRLVGQEFQRIFKSGASDIGTSLKNNVFNPLKEAILGVKDENGNYQNGLLSQVRNYLGDTFKHIRYTLVGTGYTSSDGTQYADNKDSVFGTIKRGILNKLFGPEELDENGNPTGERKGGLFSKFKDFFSQGLNAWKEKIIGEPLEGQSEEDIKKKVQAKVNSYTKDATIGGAIGAGFGIFAGSSLLGSIIGGPITGVGLGIAGSILAKNESFQNWLFGEKDENGDRIGGFISKGTQDYLKKHKLDIIGGGAIGILTHSLFGKGGGLLGTLVGGPIVGAGLGIATTLVARSEKMKNFLFGNPDTAQKGLLPGIRDAFKKGADKFAGSIGVNLSQDTKILSMSGLGILGGALASAVLPGGPVFGALMGLGASIAANGSAFKKFLFGEDYIDEYTGEKKHKHGLFGRIGNMLNANFLRPLKTQFVHWGKQIALNLEYTVGDSLSFMAEAISEKVGGVVGAVKSKFDEVANDISGFIKNSILTPFAEILNKTIVTPVKKVISGAAKLAYEVNQHILLAPFKLIKAIQFTVYNKLSDAWRNSKLKAALDTGKDWLKRTIKTEIKSIGRQIVGLTKLAFSPIKLAFKGIGTALQLGVYGAKKGMKWLSNTKFGKAFGITAPTSRTQEQLDGMTRAERWRERRKQEKEARAKINKEYKEQKIRDKNAKIIQKYTKGQYSSDTAEARYMAKVMSGGKASKYLDTTVETEDALTRRAREQTEGISLIGKGFKDIVKLPFSKLSENAQIAYVLKKIYDKISGNDDDSDRFSDKNDKELERRFSNTSQAEREKGYTELTEIINKHKDATGNIDYDAVEREVKDTIDNTPGDHSGLDYAFSATKLRLAQAKTKGGVIAKAASSRFFGDEVTMHGGVKGFLRHKFNEGILNFTSGHAKYIYDYRADNIAEQVQDKLTKLLSKKIIYLDPGETVVTVANRVLKTGILRNTKGELIDLDGNKLQEGNMDSTAGLKDSYSKYSKGYQDEDADFSENMEDVSSYDNYDDNNLIMQLRNKAKKSEASLRNKGRKKMMSNNGKTNNPLENLDELENSTVEIDDIGSLEDLAKRCSGCSRQDSDTLQVDLKHGIKTIHFELTGDSEKLDRLERLINENNASATANGGNGTRRKINFGGHGPIVRVVRGGKGFEAGAAAIDTNPIMSTISNVHQGGQRLAHRIAEQTRDRTEKLFTAIKENTAVIRTRASNHFAEWKSVFGKKGKLATALLLASPFIVKAFKWLASSPLGKIVGNIFKTLTGQDNQEGSLSEKIKNIFTDENGNSYFDNFKKTFKTEVDDIRKNGFFKWADNKLMNGPFGELYENTKSIVGAASTIAMNIGKGVVELVKKINWESFATAIVKIADLMGSLINGVTGIIAKLTNKVATNTNGQSNAEHAASEARNTFNAVKQLAPGEDFDPLQAPGTFITDEEGNWNASSQAKMNLLMHPGAIRGTAAVMGGTLKVAGKGVSVIPTVGTKIVGGTAQGVGKVLSKGANIHSAADIFNPKSASGFRAVSGGLNYIGTKSMEHATAKGAKALEKKIAAEAAAKLAETEAKEASQKAAMAGLSHSFGVGAEKVGLETLTDLEKEAAKLTKKSSKLSKQAAKYEKKVLKHAKNIEINSASLASTEKGAGGVLKNMITRIKETIKNFFKKIVDLVKHKGAKGTTKSVDEAEKIIKEAVEKFGPKEVGQVEKVTAEAEAKTATGAATLGVGTIVFEVGGGILGMIARGGKAGAAKLFQVSQDDVDTGMEIIAAILGGFSGTTIGAIVDVIFDIINTLTGWNGWHNIANALYNLFAGDSDEARLKDAQTNFMDEYNSYVLEQTEKSLEEAKKSGKVDKNMSVDEYKQWAEENNEVIKHKSFDDWNLEQNKTIGDKVGEKAAKIGGHIRGVTDEAVSIVGDKIKSVGDFFTGGDYGRKLIGSRKVTAYQVLSGEYAGYYYHESSNGKWSLCDADGYDQEVPPITDEELTSLIQQGIIKATNIKIMGKTTAIAHTILNDAAEAWSSLFKKRDENQENSAKIATSLGEKLLDNIRKSSKLADAISKGNGLVSKIMSTDEKYLVGDGTYYKNENGKYVYYSATDEVLENPRTDEEVEQSIKSGIFIKDVTSHFDFTKIKETGAKLKEKLSNAWTDMFNNRDSVLYKVREGVTAAFSLINPIAGAGLGILKLTNQYGWFDPSDGSYYVADGETYKHYNANGDLIDETVNADEVNEKIKLGLLTKEKIPLKNAAKNSLQNFKDRAKELWNKTTEATSKFFNKASDFMSSVYETIHEKFPTVSKIVDGIVEGINNFISGIKEHATGIWNEVKDTTTGYIENITSLWGGNGKGSKSRKKLPKGGRGPDDVNGVPYYSQSDSAWSSNKYGDDGATMDDTGCGPTAMSMIASKMTGQSVLPTETAALAEMTGDRDDTGTNWNFIDNASNAYGINTTEEFMPSSQFISSELKSGKPMILSGASGNGRYGGRGDDPYTDAGHYVVATGIDSNGNVDISDPRGKSYNKKYKLNDIVNRTGKAWSFDNGQYGGFGDGYKSDKVKYKGTLTRDNNGGYNYKYTYNDKDKKFGSLSKAWSVSTNEKDIFSDINNIDALADKIYGKDGIYSKRSLAAGYGNNAPSFTYNGKTYVSDAFYKPGADNRNIIVVKDMNELASYLKNESSSTNKKSNNKNTKTSVSRDEYRKGITRDSNGGYHYTDADNNSYSFPAGMTEDAVINKLISDNVKPRKIESSREELHQKQIEWLKENIGNRVADFSNEGYTTKAQCDVGQCTWYAEGRAYERAKWGALDTGSMLGNGNQVVANAGKLGFPIGNEIADDSVASIDTGSDWGHAVYIEGFDEKNNMVYWTEANGDGLASQRGGTRAEDGCVIETPMSEFPLWGGKVLGYAYTNADPYTGKTYSTSNDKSSTSASSMSSSGKPGSNNSSTSSSSSKDSKPSILDFISQVFSRVGTALINGLFTGNFNVDFSDILASIRGEKSSSESSNATIGTSTSSSSSTGTSTSSSSSNSDYEYSSIDNREDSMKSGAKGVDISYAQTNCDYKKAKADGIEFAMIKIGQGQNITDEMFEEHYAGCINAGIHVGGYYYCVANNENEAIAEAKRCLDIIKGKKFDMPIAYDVEEKYRTISLESLGAEKVSKIIEAFCSVLEKNNYLPMVYGSENATFDHVTKETKNKYALWVANWGSHQPTLKWKIWQYAGDPQEMQVKGIPGKAVDMDKCNTDYPSLIMQKGLNGYKQGEKNTDNKKNGDNRSDSLDSVKSKPNNSKVIFVGDSRTVGMYTSVNAYNGEGMNAIYTEGKDGNVYIAQVSQGIQWFTYTAPAKIAEYAKGSTNAKVVIWLGINDVGENTPNTQMTDTAKLYAYQAEKIASSIKNTIYFVSVGHLASKSKNSDYIKSYNSALKKAINELKNDKIKFIDLDSWFTEKVNDGTIKSSDGGLHYDASSYRAIYNEILSKIGAGGSGKAIINRNSMNLPELIKLNKTQLGGLTSNVRNSSLPVKSYGGGRGTGKGNTPRINSAADYADYQKKQSSTDGTTSSGTHDNSKHIQELKAAVGQRLADFSSEGYTSKAQCDAGQCTWYAEGRAWERANWEGLNKGVSLGNGQDVVNTVSGLGLPTGSEIADDSLASMHSSSPYGHVVYVEGVDKDNQTVYWSEANGNSDNVVSADDGVIQATPFSEWQNKNIIGYAYTDASNNYVPLGTASSTSSDASMSSSSSSSSAEDGMNFIASVFSEAGRRMSNALFTGELDTDYSGFLSGLKSSSSSSSSSSSDASFDSSSSASSDAAGTVDGNSVKEQVWNALAGYGYSAAAIAGIMGNIEQESGFDPGVYSQDGGGGLVQWTPWGSKIGAYSQEVKGDNLAWRNDVGLQMEYLHKTMTNSGRNDTIYSDWVELGGMTYDEFKSISDPIRAAESFMKVYERPGIPMSDNRRNAAQKYYDEFANKATKKSNTSTSSSSMPNISSSINYKNYMDSLNSGGYGSRKKSRAGKGNTNTSASIKHRNAKSIKDTTNKINKYTDDLIKSNRKITNRGGYGLGTEDFSIESGLIDGGTASDIYRSTNHVTNNINTSQVDPASMQQIIGLLNNIVTNTYNTSNGISGLSSIKPQNIVNNNSTVIQDTIRNMEAAHKPKTSLAGDSSRNTIIARKIARGL